MCKKVLKCCKDVFLICFKCLRQPKEYEHQRTPVSPPLSVDQVNRLFNKLDGELIKYKKDLLAYKVWNEAIEQRVPSEVKDKLIEKYGEVLGRPVLLLNNIFITKKDWQMSSEVEKRWLSKKGITYIDGHPSGFQIEEVLDEDTDKEAHQIVKKALTDYSKGKSKLS